LPQDTAPTPAAKASEKNPVTMSDGSVVEFNKKQKLVKTSSIGEDGTVSVRLDFVNGETRNFNMREDMKARFAAHGAEQKLGDAIAGETNIDDAVLAVDDLIKRLDDGEWNITRAAGSFSGTSVLIQALVEASGKTVDDIKGFLSNKSQAEKLALRRSDKLKPIIERLEADKAKNSKNAVDTNSLLGELGLGTDEGAGSGKGKAKS
jgi:hypothetical protein